MISDQAKKSAIALKHPATTSSIKTLALKFFEANGDMLKMPAKVRVPLKFSVKESFKNFLVTDGLYFTTLHFSKEAI